MSGVHVRFGEGVSLVDLSISEETIETVRKRMEDEFLDQYACSAAVVTCFAEAHRGRTEENRAAGRFSYKGTDFGVRGAAWHLRRNILEEGGRVAFRGKIEDYPKFERTVDVVQQGDIFGFEHPGTSYAEKAAEVGVPYTHVGLVVGETKKKMPIVFYYFHNEIGVLGLREKLGPEFILREIIRTAIPA